MVGTDVTFQTPERNNPVPLHGSPDGAEPDIAARLYRQYGHRLFAYARALTGRRDQAEDIVQEAFLRFLERDRAPAIESLPAFLYGIVRKLGLDAARQAALRRNHEPRLARTFVLRTPAGPGEEDRLSRDALAELESLPVEQREAVVLKIFGGMTFEEIGALTGAPPATAASRYRYALEKLLERLGDGGKGP